MSEKPHAKRKKTALMTAILLFAGTIVSSFGSASANADTVDAEAAQLLAASAPPVIAEEFESVSTTVVRPSSAQANSVKLVLSSRPDPVQYGSHAVGLAYDFVGKTGTSAAYVNFYDPDGTAGRTIPANANKVGVWVYGDGNNHWLRGQAQSQAGTKAAFDFTSSTGLSWTGWKYVTGTLPANTVKITQIYVAETKDTNKNAGTLYFDRLSAFYDSASIYGLDLVGLTPMQTGETKQAKAFATYNNSLEPAELTSGVTYASSNPSVATVDTKGTVKALQPGTTTITADYNGAPKASFQLTVSADPQLPQRLELARASKLEVGQTDKVYVYATYSGVIDPLRLLSGVTFQSSNPAIATVDTNGTVKAVKAGTATITASYGGATAQYVLTTANPVPVLQKIDLTGLSALNVGESKQAKVMGTYTLLEEPVEITSGVTFTSSNASIATISTSGLVTAKAVGTSRITANYNGKSADFFLVVNQVTASPKRELRAAWIATVDNVDWPNKGVVDAEQQKRDFIAALDDLQAAGINAAIVQVKPTADAFYPSNYGPWSEWLTGVQGKDPGYNPLAFMIEEVHKRNMEFHAWFNPYRISLQDDINKLVADHPARQHPDWVVSYGGKLYFNPGVPAAKDFIIDGVMEVVDNYDIDAVHFDDYFYPYPVSGVDFPDQQEYQTYGAGFANKADWRRHNVDTFVQEMSARIKESKSYVKFGISPFGIWKNKSSDPNGSDTNGLESYSAIYADSKKWVQQEWIDYITPQIYWYFGYSPAAYEKVLDWWMKQVQGSRTQLYVGHAAYRIGAADPAWMNPDEMPNQLAYNRNFNEVKGSIFFSTKSLQGNFLGFTDRLKSDLYRYPALVPAMPWLDATAPAAPVLDTAMRKADGGIELKWPAGSDDAAYYVVYRFDGNTAGSLEDATHILGTVRKQAAAAQTYTDRTAAEGQLYTYVITAVDRVHNESAASNGVTLANTLDVAPPVTTAVVDGTLVNGWYTSDGTVTLSASDDLTGVDTTVYSMNGGASWLPYTEPVTVTEEGNFAISFRSTDRIGNEEAAKSVSFSIDKTAPSIGFEGAVVYTVDQMVLVTCTASDTVSGVAESSCTAPLVSAPAYTLGLGTHEVTATATDAAGHEGTATASFTVQATAEGLSNLVRAFVAGPGADGVANSLVTKLEQGQVEAFIHEVSAQSGKKLTTEQASVLIALAQALQ